MAPRLVDLSPELQIQIADKIYSKKDILDCNPEKWWEPRFQRAEADRRNQYRDLMNWSTTSRFFRELLAPYLFESITLRNKHNHGSAAPALSKSSLSKNVKEMVYVGQVLGVAHYMKKKYIDPNAILPKHVASVLSNLKCFPNLETLSIELPDHCVDIYGFADGYRKESDELVKSVEANVAWRALMAKTYNALSRNDGTRLKTLELRQLGPHVVSSFNDPAFHDFLGRADRFNLSMYGVDKGAGETNKAKLYTVLTSKLDVYFFDHLTSVTDLVLKAPHEGPLGLKGRFCEPLALRKDHMPALRSAHFDYILVGQELIDFFLGHLKTLECLVLHNCSANVNGFAVNGIPWKAFFDALFGARFKRLRKFDITPDDVPLIFEEEEYLEQEDETPVLAKVKQARQILQDDSSRQLFSYTIHDDDDDDGVVLDDEEENLAAFLRAEDQASFDRLMAMVQTNAERNESKQD